MTNAAALEEAPHVRFPADSAMRDRDLRVAVFRKVISDHLANPDTRVIEELGLQHGASRVDIAVVNGVLHGYELKSEVDTLVRLPLQIDAYSRVFDRVTLVVAESHLAPALPIVPVWWGIKVATRGARGAVNLETVRRVENNPTISAFHLAHLLWRNEAIHILEGLAVEREALRVNRAGLYRMLASALDLPTLRNLVRNALKVRTNWRHLPRHA